MNVPFLDLDAQYQSIKTEVLETIESVLDSKKFVQGELVDKFKKNFRTLVPFLVICFSKSLMDS